MPKVSLIYRNIWLYRMVMNALYGFGYKKRFKKVFSVLKESNATTILELCFGDILIAKYCTQNNIQWQGFDSNEYFVDHAKRKGYDAKKIDLLSNFELPDADMVVMIGSLYHFNKNIHSLLSTIFYSCNKMILSEPIKNLSSQSNIVGWAARKSANAGKGEESFRYNELSLQKMLQEESLKLNFSFKIIDRYKKDILISIEKNGQTQA